MNLIELKYDTEGRSEQYFNYFIFWLISCIPGLCF